MISRTVTAVLDAPWGGGLQLRGSFTENLPVWATDSHVSSRYENGKPKVVGNGLGESHVLIAADAGTGVIDMYAGTSENDMALFPTRVVALGRGRSAYTFTMFKAPAMDDALFESQHRSLQREFDNIRARFATKGDGSR